MTIKDKVVLITGSAKGIGEAIALEFAKNGAKIIMNYNQSGTDAERVKKEIEEIGAEVISVKANVENAEEVQKMFLEAVDKFGTVDILVNNAAYSKSSNFLEDNFDLWQNYFKNTVLGTVICSKYFARLNKDLSGKKIINITSLFGFDDKGSEEMLEYCSSKAALHSFTKNLAKLLAPNILVNAVAPGYTLTPQWSSRNDEQKNSCINETLIKRFIRPDEIASGAVFLAQNDAITGTILTIDGGLSLKG